MTVTLQSIIDQAWENRATLSPQEAPNEVRAAVNAVLDGLNQGSLRVATREKNGQWTIHQWVKKSGVAVVSLRRQHSDDRRWVHTVL